MYSGPENRHGSARAIVARVVEILNIERRKETTVQRDRKVVIGLHNLLGAIGQATVSQVQAETAQGQILTMVMGNSVDDEGHADVVARTIPQRAAEVAAEGDSLIDLGILP